MHPERLSGITLLIPCPFRPIGRYYVSNYLMTRAKENSSG